MNDPVVILTLLFAGNALLFWAFLKGTINVIKWITENQHESFRKRLSILFQEQGHCPVCGQTHPGRVGRAPDNARTRYEANEARRAAFPPILFKPSEGAFRDRAKANFIDFPGGKFLKKIKNWFSGK